VSPTSVASWRRTEPTTIEPSEESPIERAPKALVPIEVMPSPDHGVVSLVTPRGYRVEGLSLEQAAALLREFE
jgi:hypothetical protein